MTATILEPTAVETVDEASDEPDHIVCHCRDEKISWCGIDVSGIPMCEDEWEDENMCSLCILAMQMSVPGCPFGCFCHECFTHPDDI